MKKPFLIIAGVIAGLVLLHLGYMRIGSYRRPAILAAHREFMTALDEGDMQSAYELMSTDYKANHDLASFASEAHLNWEESPLSEWEASVGITSHASVYQTNEDGWSMGLTYKYVRENGVWRFTGKTQLYQD